mgnify:CR=1 FL=1
MESFEINIEDLLGMAGNADRHPVWDRPVPIKKIGDTHNAYLAGDIEEPYNYNELCSVLEAADKDETVILHINTGGGYIDSAFKIISSIKRSKAKVVARLTGTVASAGTIISLSCDDLEVEDFTHFMIHNYSTGTRGKGHEVMDYINFNDKALKKTFTHIYSGFLKPNEVKAVIDGRDMWLDADDVRKRWKLKQKETK